MKNRFTKPVDPNRFITERECRRVQTDKRRSLPLVLLIIATLALFSLAGCKVNSDDEHLPPGGTAAGEEILSDENSGNKTQDSPDQSQIDDSKKPDVGADDSTKPGTGKSDSQNKTDTKDSKPLTCTISISCATIMDNRDLLDEAKQGLVPADGWILRETSASFEEGESAFDVLLRVSRQRKIHMEYSNVPLYNSAYIEGVHNLYEFDCGPLSGWVYSVDGFFPNYGSSRYTLKDGQTLRWMYSCDLGEDVGGWNY